MRRALGVLLVFLIVLFAPLLWLRATVPIVTPDAALPAQAALIFGALVRSGQVSPLHRERLDTGVQLWEADQAERLVVSNAPRAAAIMRDYLVGRGVPVSRIEIDGTAQSTPDTCVAEAARPRRRDVILVSQAYHLPRIALQCRRLGVEGQYVAALRDTDALRDAPGTLATWAIRARRQSREALLVWSELLGLYRWLERAVSP